MAASEVLPYVRSVFNGVYDSVFGIITFFKPIYRKEDTIRVGTAPETEDADTNRTRRRARPSTTASQKCQRLSIILYILNA